MGTLRKLRLKMKLDKDLRHTLVKGTRNEILIDLDGDKLADLALIDNSGNGDIDTIALDATGDGEFNLYLFDSDNNHIPDAILFDENGDGNLKPIAAGKEVEDAMTLAAAAVFRAIELGDYVAQALDEALDSVEKEIKNVRRSLR